MTSLGPPQSALLLLVVGLVLTLLLDVLTSRYLRMPGWPPRIVVWLVTAILILNEFPATRDMAQTLLLHVVNPLVLLVGIAAGAFLSGRGLERLSDFYFRDLEAFWRQQQHPRWQQRSTMLRQATAVTIGVLVTAVALLIYLHELGVNLSALVAGAGLFSIGVSWVGKDLLADWMAGFNIVLEDQFGVGDVIDTGTYVGTVEQFNMRVTRLRDIEGNLITVANATMRTVKNLSATWSQVDFSVRVKHGTDVRRALDLMAGIAVGLHAEWPERVLDEPKVLGVDELSAEGVRLRVLVKTAPLEQWKVRRELLLRLEETFVRERIELG